VPDEERAEIAAEAGRAQSLREVGERFGVSSKTVRNICLELGIALRPRGAPRFYGPDLYVKHGTKEKGWPLRPRLAVVPGGIRL
jgi:hypothetical protein